MVKNTNGDKMKIKSALCCIGIGIGGTILYQQLKSGNLKNTLKKMDKAKMKFAENLEEML